MQLIIFTEQSAVNQSFKIINHRIHQSNALPPKDCVSYKTKIAPSKGFTFSFLTSTTNQKSEVNTSLNSLFLVNRCIKKPGNRLMTCEVVKCLQGFCRVTSSHKITPKLKTSDFSSDSSSRSTSGAIHSGF